MDRFGRVAVDGKDPVNFTELHRVLTNRVAMNTNVPVFITGHKQTSHGSMVYVLDFVRRSGVNKVAFAVKANQ